MTSPARRSISPLQRPISMLREFMEFEAAGGIVLLGAAVLGLVMANSDAAPYYFEFLEFHLGPLSLLHWINDGLMAVFFLLVGLEIKHELLRGELASPSQRLLPGLGALAGMIAPAVIYTAFNHGDPVLARGWAIPAATDIAFALGLLSLLGKRVPASLTVFLAALAIIDDLGAIVVIALFYGGTLSWGFLLAAGVVAGLLFQLNRSGVSSLPIYCGLGLILWFCFLNSGIHATLAGVILAFSIPLETGDDSPLHRLENKLDRFVPFLLVPIFGFANAGVSLEGISLQSLSHPLNLGIILGLLLGKGLGIFTACTVIVRFFGGRLPQGASWFQFLGVCFVCGIGFTMSLFINMLAFVGSKETIDEAKIGIILGSICSAIIGTLILWKASARPNSEVDIQEKHRDK